jgi:glycosyltransferase involved in cell wall biosynthesis
MRFFTWHVHGAYLRSLLAVEHEWVVPVKEGRPPGYAGLPDDAQPWPSNVREIPAAEVAGLELDAVVFQHQRNWAVDQHEILSAAQRAGPRIHVEHDPPFTGSPTDSRHPVDDPGVLLVHVTPYNALMWDTGDVPTTVIEHGVADTGVRWTGELDRGIAVVNHLARRGRRLGADVFARARDEAGLPLDLVGMAAEESGGLGEVKPHLLPEFEARYRFLFNPIRYTSLGLAVVEAMMIGLPVVALATTQHAVAVRDGVTGYTDTDERVLHERMRELLADRSLAARLSEGARAEARERYALERFAAEWTAALEGVVRRQAP